MPLVSVIMTSYNTERYIRESIDSILSQTYTDYELIIVDDGSTDRTVEIIESYSSNKIRLFKQSHCGRAAALNTACKRASGEFIAFMDSDDVAFPTRFEKQLDYLRNNTKIDIVSAWFYRVTENGRIKRLVKLPCNHEKIVKTMFKSCALVFGCTMLRAWLLEKVGSFDENLLIAEDYDYLMRALVVSHAGNIDEPLLYYRQRPDSITMLAYQKSKDSIYNILYNYLDNDVIKKTLPRQKYLSFAATCEYYYGSVERARQLCINAFKLKDYSTFTIFVRSLLGTYWIMFFRKVEMRTKYYISIFIQKCGKSLSIK